MGTWIEIWTDKAPLCITESRSLRGNVDRNTSTAAKAVAGKDVVPYVGTWIEMLAHCELFHRARVVPYVGTWIEIALVRV